MRQPTLRRLLVGLCGAVLCSPATGALGASPTAAGLGFAAAFGAGATSWVDPAAALFENPARLARLTHGQAWSSIAVPSGGEVLRLAVNAPLLAGPAVGVGFARRAGTYPLQSVHLGAAQQLPRGLAAGGALTLQAQSEADAVRTTFGLDLGLHWQPRARFEAAVALANAIEPDLDAGDTGRELRAAAAWLQPVHTAWSTGVCVGWRGRAGSQAEASVAALLRHRRTELAAGVHGSAWRAGTALLLGAWRFSYAYDAGGDGTHDLAMQWRFGLGREARRAAAERRTELAIAGRVHDLAAAVEQARIAATSAAAESAWAERRFEAAVGHYRALLALQPESAPARAGLRRAQHGMWVHWADSLLAHHETAAATVALQQALHHAPEDSVSARRVQELRTAASTASRMQDLVAQRFADGMQAYAQQRYLDAVGAFEDVLRLDPEHASAATSLQQAQAAHDVWRTSTLRSARQRYDAGDDIEATAFVRRVLDVEPRQAEAQKLLARIERRAQRARSDASHPAPPVQMARSEDAAPATAAVASRYAEGMQLFRGGDLVGAMQAWEEVSRLAPHYDEVDRNLLRVYRVTGLESYTEGRLREAIEIWEKALRLEPGNEQLRRYVNQAHEKLKRTQPPEPSER